MFEPPNRVHIAMLTQIILVILVVQKWNLRNTAPNRSEKLVSQALHRPPSATQTFNSSAGSPVQFKLCMMLSLQLQILLGDGKTRVKKNHPVYTVGAYTMTCTTVPLFHPLQATTSS